MTDEYITGLDPIEDVPSAAAIKLAKADLSEKIYARMAPFYNRQIQLVRSEIANSFNAKIAEVKITIDVMKDFKALRNDAIHEFDATLKTLAPAGSGWNGGYEVHELIATLDDYLDGREANFRMMGVMSRGRQPIDVSFHTFFHHPLGRDYRQEPLGLSFMKDTPFYQDAAEVNR